MLGGQVDPPLHGELEFHLFLVDVFFEDFDGFGIGDAGESRRVGGGDGLEPLPRARCGHGRKHFALLRSARVVFEEIQLGGAASKSLPDAKDDEVLGAAHVVSEVGEGDFRLDHPELGQVARGVAVLGAEGWAKSVDRGEGAGVVLGC